MKKFILLSLLSLTTYLYASPVKEGVDYTIATNVVPITPLKGRVNIKEFFSFTCIHCKDVEPLLEATIAKNKRVNLEKIQVPWDDKTTSLAKLNATYVLMNLNRLYAPTFDAIFSGLDLTDNKVLTGFLVRNKVDVTKFMANYNSFDVSMVPGKYKNLMQQYNVTGTPTFVVDNKYILKPAVPQRIIEVLQYLIKQEK